jgi:hypothetical protein
MVHRHLIHSFVSSGEISSNPALSQFYARLKKSSNLLRLWMRLNLELRLIQQLTKVRPQQLFKGAL